MINKTTFIQFLKRYTILCLLLSLVIISCKSDPNQLLNSKISAALRNDNTIDKEEWEQLNEYILHNQEFFPEFIVEENKINAEELTNLIYRVADKRRNQPKPTIYKVDGEMVSNSDTDINVFIENSGSMDGYVRNQTDFEVSLSDLLVELLYEYGKDRVHVNFINNAIYPSEIDEVENFTKALDPGKPPYKIGNRNASEINEILEMVLDSVATDKIAILFSDCIYSLKKGDDTEGALGYEKSLTKNAFLQKFRGNPTNHFSTLILKLNSQFDGIYYDKYNQGTYLEKTNRPYYIWIIGEKNRIDWLLENIQFRNLVGFDRSYLLTGGTESYLPFFTVLKETNKIGAFQQTDRTEDFVNEICEIEYEDGVFQFSIAIDLNGLEADSDFLLSKANYALTDGFQISRIEEIDRNKLTPRDRVTIDKTDVSHLITIRINQDYAIQNMELKLTKTIPDWVYNSSTLNDLDEADRKGKTFGLSYLIEGAADAYSKHYKTNTAHFSIELKIKK